MIARAGFIVGIVGLLGWGAAWLLDPAGALAEYLVAWTAVTTVVVGVLLQIMISYLSNGRWFAVYRRLGLAVIGTLPALAVLALPLLLGVRTLYAWAHPAAHLADSGRRAWLTPGFFALRFAICLAVWIVFAAKIRRYSLAQDTADADGIVAAHVSLRRWSAAGVIAVGLALTLAAFDWLMTVEPDWYSTIYGIYVGAGALLGGLALLAVLMPFVAGRRPDVRRWLVPDRTAALGAMLLTFALFWGYIAFSQYLIIWIGDVPADASWYVDRVRGVWRGLAAVAIVGQFVAPFCLLLSRAGRRRESILAVTAAGILLAHLADIAWLVLPAFPRRGAIVWPAAAALLLIGGAAVAVATARSRRMAWVPVGDPALDPGPPPAS